MRDWSRRDVVRGLALAGASSMLGRPTGAEATKWQGTAPEILIRGGRVINADGESEADVRIIGDTIREVAAGLRPGPGARVIDATARLVLPGGIDPHTHLHPSFADDLGSGSMAALAGGITTVGTFANAQKGEGAIDAVDRMAATAEKEAIADVILHAVVWPPSEELIAALPRLVEKGQPSVKFFMTRADFGARLDMVVRTLEAAREAGVVTMMHCEDGTLLNAAVRRLTAAGRTSLQDYAQSRPIVAEVVATEQAGALCESTNAPIYVVHLSAARALEACRRTRARRLPFYVETRPLFIHLSEEKLTGPEGPLFVGQPPLRTRDDIAAMWRGLADGSIDTLATDHAPWTREQKMDPTLSIARVRPGASDLQFMLPMYFSEGVGKRRLPLSRFVETTSTAAARIFGLYPRKGVIRANADADIAIWDPKRTAPVRAADDMSKSDYSPYEGWQVTGWPVMTIRRGEVVFGEGRISGAPGSGRVVARDRWRS